MSYELLGMISNSWFSLLGGTKLIFPLVIIAILVIALLIVRCPKAAILMIIVPLIVTMVTFTSQIIGLNKTSVEWIGVIVFMIMGVVMAGVFWMVIR